MWFWWCNITDAWRPCDAWTAAWLCGLGAPIRLGSSGVNLGVIPMEPPLDPNGHAVSEDEWRLPLNPAPISL